MVRRSSIERAVVGLTFSTLNDLVESPSISGTSLSPMEVRFKLRSETIAIISLEIASLLDSVLGTNLNRALVWTYRELPVDAGWGLQAEIE